MNRRQKRQLVSLLLALGVLLFGVLTDKYPHLLGPVYKEVPAGMYHVVSVEDGDTIIIDMNGTNERVRFVGVDTPETKDPRKPVQCFGYAASEFTRNLIDDNPVRLEADPLSTNRDRYDRLLRYIYLPDGTLVQAEIIKQGYGFAYTSFPFTKSDAFRQYQKEARQAERGLWSSCEPQPNGYGGYDSNPE